MKRLGYCIHQQSRDGSFGLARENVTQEEGQRLIPALQRAFQRDKFTLEAQQFRGRGHNKRLINGDTPR